MSQHFDKTIKTAFALQTNQYMFDLDSPFSTNKNLNRTIRLRFLFVEGTVDEPCAQMSTNCVIYRLQYYFTFSGNSTMRAGSAACTARRLRPFLPPAMWCNIRPNTTLFNPMHLWRTSTSSSQEEPNTTEVIRFRFFFLLPYSGTSDYGIISHTFQQWSLISAIPFLVGLWMQNAVRYCKTKSH